MKSLHSVIQSVVCRPVSHFRLTIYSYLFPLTVILTYK